MAQAIRIFNNVPIEILCICSFRTALQENQFNSWYDIKKFWRRLQMSVFFQYTVLYMLLFISLCIHGTPSLTTFLKCVETREMHYWKLQWPKKPRNY